MALRRIDADKVKLTNLLNEFIEEDGALGPEGQIEVLSLQTYRNKKGETRLQINASVRGYNPQEED